MAGVGWDELVVVGGKKSEFKILITMLWSKPCLLTQLYILPLFSLLIAHHYFLIFKQKCYEASWNSRVITLLSQFYQVVSHFFNGVLLLTFIWMILKCHNGSRDRIWLLSMGSIQLPHEVLLNGGGIFFIPKIIYRWKINMLKTYVLVENVQSSSASINILYLLDIPTY